MLKEEHARGELKALRLQLYGELWQRAGDMTLHSLESLCRKIHILDLKLHSFRGGIKNEKD